MSIYNTINVTIETYLCMFVILLKIYNYNLVVHIYYVLINVNDVHVQFN